MNSLKINLKEGDIVVVGSAFCKGDEEDRKFKVEGGFGMATFTSGSAIYGKFVKTGEKCRVEGYMLEKKI